MFSQTATAAEVWQVSAGLAFYVIAVLQEEEILPVHGEKDVRETEICTAEPSTFEVDIAKLRSLIDVIHQVMIKFWQD
jgi:hypothetical protein